MNTHKITIELLYVSPHTREQIENALEGKHSEVHLPALRTLAEGKLLPQIGIHVKKVGEALRYYDV